MRWQLQMQILFSWIVRTKENLLPSSIPVELIGMLLNKAEAKFCQLVYKPHKDSESD
jgi:hypothetical protein